MCARVLVCMCAFVRLCVSVREFLCVCARVCVNARVRICLRDCMLFHAVTPEPSSLKFSMEIHSLYPELTVVFYLRNIN